MSDFEEYIKQDEPDKVTKSQIWQAAIGLQKVDNLTPSDYLIETARQNIEGCITIDEVQYRIEGYYKTKEVDRDDRTEEADTVSARIAKLLSSDTFSFSPVEYTSIHKALFTGIYKHAGKLREYNITKAEWVLNSATVFYAHADMLRATLEYDFEREKVFDYKGLSRVQVVEHIARFIADLWQIHPFGEGNTRTTAVFAIKYLRKLGFTHIDNEPFAQHSWYFRNALVRANYEDLAHGIHKSPAYLVRFFENLLLGGKNELRNRYLHVNWAGPESVATDGGVKVENGGVNGGVSLLQKRILDLLGQNPHISAAEIAKQTDTPHRTIENNLKKLKESGTITREGADKNGKWIILLR
jgi:fido (protein-threonine AMPylation protein)